MFTEVVQAKYLDGYKISVQFNDGVRKIVDFSELLKRNLPAFAPLKNIETFRQFVVTDTLEWNNGNIDIAPEFLYENGTETN